MVEPEFSIAIRIFSRKHERLIMGTLLEKLDEKDGRTKHICWTPQGDYPYDALIWWAGEEGFRSADRPPNSEVERCHKRVDTEWLLSGKFDREWDLAMEEAQKLSKITWRDVFDGKKVIQGKGEACRRARESGYKYVLWNGQVFKLSTVGQTWEETNVTEEHLNGK